MTHSNRKTFRRRLRASLACFAAFLVLAYVYWLVMTNLVVRDFWDPAYVNKLELLNARLATHPGRPLWLVMGSSHVHDGLAPETLPDKINDGKSPLLFNFGESGADLFYQFICLRRLLDAGIAPARVGIEFDMLLSRDYPDFVENPALVPRARRGELAEYCDYSDNPRAVRTAWLESRLNPFFEHGMKAPYQALPLRLVPFLSHFEKQPNTQWGWLEVHAKHPPKEEFDAMAGKFARFSTGHTKDPVPPSVQRALHSILDLCRARNISLFLIRMPEAAVARDDSPEALATIQAYLDQFSHDEQIPVIDARGWVPDEGFFDLHHLNADGATQFTKKLAGVLYANKPQ